MLDDKYRIERLLAVGGMGAVYLGTHIKLRKRVAIKVLNPQMCSTSMVERFHREAITASQIGHEGIAQVTDLDTSHEGEPFLVMEYLEGESLAKRLRASGPLLVHDACELGCAILSPLSAAHHAGIVHRDLKPDNVFLVRQSYGEMVKLLDFGISRVTGLDAEFRLTNTGLVLGTPYYMSPEQARGESDITPAADLYAFGVMLYEMLVGDVPIRAENYNQLMYRVTIGDFERPRERRPDLPKELERIILHAMAQAAEDRPASAIDLEQALLPFCRPAFRDSTSGRISAPRLSFATSRLGNPARGSNANIDPAMFAGATVSATSPGEIRMAPGDTEQVPAARVDEYGDPHVHAYGDPHVHAYDDPHVHAYDDPHVHEHGHLHAHDVGHDAIAGRDELASQPALPVSAFPDDTFDSITVPRRSPIPRILTAIALVGVAAASTGALVRVGTGHDSPTVVAAPASRGTQPAPQPAQPAPQPMSQIDRPAPGNGDGTKAPAGGPAAHTPATITLKLAIEPSGAAILLDGQRKSGTELVMPRDTAAHRLQITAAGYLGYDERISFDESQRLVVQLKHTAGPARGKDPHKDGPGTGQTDRIDSNSPYK
jgi:serine/threonine protein kinase